MKTYDIIIKRFDKKSGAPVINFYIGVSKRNIFKLFDNKFEHPTYLRNQIKKVLKRDYFEDQIEIVGYFSYFFPDHGVEIIVVDFEKELQKEYLNTVTFVTDKILNKLLRKKKLKMLWKKMS